MKHNLSHCTSGSGMFKYDADSDLLTTFLITKLHGVIMRDTTVQLHSYTHTHTPFCLM